MNNRNFKYRKRILSVIMTVALVLGSVGEAGTGNVSAEDTLTPVSFNGYTYYTDSNGTMAYRFTQGGIDLIGKVGTTWSKVTYQYSADTVNGFRAYYRKNGDASKDGTYIGFSDSSNDPVTLSGDFSSLSVTRTIEFTENGSLVYMGFVVSNNGTEDFTGFDFGVMADTMIYQNDKSKNEPLVVNGSTMGFQMTDDVYPITVNGKEVNVSFILACKGISSNRNKDADEYWYGYLGDAGAFQKSSNISDERRDSAIAYSWLNRTIPAGGSIEFKTVCGIGDITQLKEALGSLSAKLNYSDESISGLTAGTYKLEVVGGSTYYVTVEDGGSIPLEGTAKDGNGNDVKYSLVDSSGSETSVTITEVDPATHVAKSKSTTYKVVGRSAAPSDDIGGSTETEEADTPEAAKRQDVIISSDKITITNPKEGQEYSIDSGKTWKKADDSGQISFEGLDANTDYTIITRYCATDAKPASNSSAGVIITSKERKSYNSSFSSSGYEGVYDGKAHSITVEMLESDSSAQITYSSSYDGKYSDTKPEFTEPGKYTVYYKITRDGYYPAYGQETVVINKLSHGDVNYSKLVSTSGESGITLNLKNTDIIEGAKAGTPVCSGDALMSNMSLDTDKLTFTYTAPKAQSGSVGTVTIPVTGSAHYSDYNIILTVKYTGKTIVNISNVSGEDGVYNGASYVGYTGVPSYTGNYTDILEASYEVDTGNGVYVKTTAANSGSLADGQAPVYAGNYRVTLSVPDTDNIYAGMTVLDFSITPKPVTVSDITVADKSYDGTVDAVPDSGSGKIDGIVGSDDLSIDMTNVKAAFSDKNAGDNISVAVSGFTLKGEAAGNYTLSNLTSNTAADIKKKKLNVTASAKNREYNGSTIVTVTGSIDKSDIISDDEVSVIVTSGNIADKNVGTNKKVSNIVFTLTGADKDNYTAVTANADSAAVNITPKKLSVVWSDTSFNYDGAYHKPKAELNGVCYGDLVSLNVSGEMCDYSDTAYTAYATLAGTDKDNYILPEEYAKVSFYITNKEDSSDASVSTESPATTEASATTETPAPDSAKTGDNTPIAPVMILLICGEVMAIGIAAYELKGKKSIKK